MTSLHEGIARCIMISSIWAVTAGSKQCLHADICDTRAHSLIINFHHGRAMQGIASSHWLFCNSVTYDLLWSYIAMQALLRIKFCRRYVGTVYYLHAWLDAGPKLQVGGQSYEKVN